MYTENRSDYFTRVRRENSDGDTEENHASDGCREEQCRFVEVFIVAETGIDSKLKKTQTWKYNNHSRDRQRRKRRLGSRNTPLNVLLSEVPAQKSRFMLFISKNTKHIPVPEVSRFREPDVSNEQEKYESNVTAVSKSNLVVTVSHREQQQQATSHPFLAHP